VTLLQYGFVTQPALLQTGTQTLLTLAVSNSRSQAVTCTSITVTLPIGTNAKDLAAASSAIGTVLPPGWNAAQQGGQFTLTPTTPDAGKIGGQGLAFIFTGITVNDQPGICTIRIDEFAAAQGSAPVESSTTFPLTKFPATFTLSPLTAIPLEVEPGNSATILWNGSPATYTLSYDPDGKGSQNFTVGNIGAYPSKPLTNAAGVDFTLTAEVSVPGSDQVLTLQEQINVGVANPPPTITRFTATLAGVYTPNATATLTWKVAGSDAECTLTGVSQLLAPNGTIALPLGPSPSSFTLTASNVNGVATSTITVTAALPRVVALPDAPLNLALSADGTTVYAACAATLCAVDVARGTVTASRAWFGGPEVVNVLPDGTLIAIDVGQDIHILDGTTLATKTDPVRHWGAGLPSRAPYPYAAAVSKDGSRWWAPYSGGVCAYVVQPPSGTADGFVNPDSPGSIVISPDGSLFFVYAPQVACPASSNGEGSPRPAPSGTQYIGAAFAPSGKTVYALTSAPSDGTKTLSALDAGTLQSSASVTYGSGTPPECCGVAVALDGATVFSAGFGTVTVIDASSLTVTATIPAVPNAPTTDIRLTPDGSTLVVGSYAGKSLAVVTVLTITGGVTPS
jgi:hypothetical protein